MTLPQTGLRIDGAAVRVALWLLFCAVPLASSGQQVFKGEIAGTCAGPAACGKKGTHYVLSDSANKTVYQLDNQRKPKAFAGMQVVVIGTLDEATATIHVSQMFRALPPKVMQAETVAIVCDACLRDMAEAKPAALKALEDWGRFEVRPNPKHVDLIFLLSANPYLGDYVTRDGPDTRPVHVDVTFMNVIDPRTGESLWGDSRQWGSWFVARATKDLMAEFREQLEAGDHHAARLLFPRDGTRGGESRNKSSLTTWLRSSNAWIATRTENSTITSYNSCVCQTWIEHVFTFSLSILRYASVTQAIQMHRP